MIVLYWHCLDMTEADERFVGDALDELSQFLRTKLPQLTIKLKRLKDEPEVAKEVAAILNKVGNESDAFQRCSLNIEKILPITANLLVYCLSNEPIAKAAMRESPSLARQGYTGDYVNYVRGALFAAVYKQGLKSAIWHEALHLLRADDCYEENNPSRKKASCDVDNCIMEWDSTPDRPVLCDDNINRIHKKVEEILKKEGVKREMYS